MYQLTLAPVSHQNQIIRYTPGQMAEPIPPVTTAILCSMNNASIFDKNSLFEFKKSSEEKSI
ncbi:hypothetical protein [Legionella anisa]|uniref:hypothetical protein n=1 Tax=Legionella anisa TaxID=28082 RepID=UPI0010415EE7|nr:hypothetical protein [Legionella anisa]MCW8426816.1 hypothetical protein [Legionella anisa]MCW8449515.1 hypothetical protein [Legionella anisa]